MYDELIAKLKFAESVASESEKYTWASLCMAARKAIEDLRQKYLDSECDAIELTGELASKPFWMDASECVPKRSDPKNRREWFLVALESGMVQSLAYEFDDDSSLGKGWHMTGSPVTHWMPLPKHPKEMEID